MNDFDDDDFFLDKESIKSENQMTIAQETMYKILEYSEKLISQMKENLKFNEISDFERNYDVLSQRIATINDIVVADDLSDEEQQELIEKTLKNVTELDFDNMDLFVEKEDSKKINEEDVSDDDSSLDF